MFFLNNHLSCLNYTLVTYKLVMCSFTLTGFKKLEAQDLTKNDSVA